MFIFIFRSYNTPQVSESTTLSIRTHVVLTKAQTIILLLRIDGYAIEIFTVYIHLSSPVSLQFGVFIKPSSRCLVCSAFTVSFFPTTVVPYISTLTSQLPFFN